jgi:serine/threonine protein kinase
LRRRDTPETERLAILARLATDLERLYGMGMKPCGFGPGDVVIRASSIPVIASFDGPESALRPERAAERVFVAPEVLKPDANPDFRADLYVIGALLITWFGGDPPANKGFWLSLTRAWKRPLKKRGGLLAELALELTALDPKNRPESASIAADRLHQAALALSLSQAAA